MGTKLKHEESTGGRRMEGKEGGKVKQRDMWIKGEGEDVVKHTRPSVAGSIMKDETAHRDF